MIRYILFLIFPTFLQNNLKPFQLTLKPIIRTNNRSLSSNIIQRLIKAHIFSFHQINQNKSSRLNDKYITLDIPAAQ